ncbi:MAG: hypothetical protein V1874_01295 [Spirochaetota bacterium]
MNLFFKKYIILIFLLIFIPEALYAINIQGLYVSSCERELGVILKVEKSKITLLTLEGKFKEIPRYEIIYFTSYSIDSFPYIQIQKNELEDIVQIDTVQNNKIVNLIEGWPIDYSENDISFLTLDGHEVLISKENIWKIKIKKISKEINFNNNGNINYEFVHPYPFRLCPVIDLETQKGKAKTIKVFPQQMLNDSVQIKIELDRIKAGRERIDKYNTYQQFYAVPQIYKNYTSLGYWFSYGSRYGSSNSRNNNLTPILQNEYSSGIFGYQHIFLTGSAPMPYSVHEETQTQIYYRFKVDYFHLGIMIDPNMFLVPWEKYKWKSGDLKTPDDGLNPSISFETGLDYGRCTLQWYYDSLNMGIRDGSKNNGYYGFAPSYRFGASYQNHFLKIELQFDPFSFMGNKYNDSTDDSENNANTVPKIKINTQIGILRFNLETIYLENINIRYSYIYRRIKFKNSYNGYEVGNDITGVPGIDSAKDQLFKYRSDSHTNAVYLIYTYKNKYNFGFFTALEYHKARSTTLNKSYEDSSLYPKFGIYASLFF